ncbi:uncharacterized protein LOC125455427 isoform X2 [Stegostoma tigrinum]|uniref:uncharacterized protein LOC125455427 isoform X2 n=1 Tax=Stegostoma tigrinum TaxID=3053191 RepID=UPI00202B0029|nr:uncharacterized protein LOC125455427 isoform X2 [Stegostoma tigrinum]
MRRRKQPQKTNASVFVEFSTPSCSKDCSFIAMGKVAAQQTQSESRVRGCHLAAFLRLFRSSVSAAVPATVEHNMRDGAQTFANCTFSWGRVNGAEGANKEQGMQSEDWKQDARIAWGRLQTYITSSKVLRSENIGPGNSDMGLLVRTSGNSPKSLMSLAIPAAASLSGNSKGNSAKLEKSNSALYTHIPHDGLEQKNLRIIHYVKKVPRYHINRKHDVKYWYEEPAVGMSRRNWRASW